MSAGAKERFVFKQSYKSRNLKSTKTLNLKHLAYIATRPGVMKNKECDFGLWGKLPGMEKIDDIETLRKGKEAIAAASDGHTIYRAILSVSKETARQYNLYDREEWEKLLRSKIDVLRRGMGIKKENFCWTAAMHYKKNHPHVHIMYWDNGKEPRREYISKERFEAVSEEIRKALTAAIENDAEIQQLLSERDALEKETRLKLNAMLKQSNLPDVLDLDHIKPHTADALGEELKELLQTLPRKGRLNYAFLDAGYKAKLDSFLDNVMKISDFSKIERQMLDYAAEISELYGNKDEVVDKRVEEAARSFRKALANETLRYLKDVKAELEARAPEFAAGDGELLMKEVRKVVTALARAQPEYQELLNRLPNERAPVKALLGDARVKEISDMLTKRLANDMRVRSIGDAYYKSQTSENDSKEDKASARKAVNRTIFRATGNALWDALAEDKGYAAQQNRDSAIMCLLRIFRDASQEKNQMQASRALARERYRNLSETARRNLRKEREQEGAWSPDF